MSLGIILYSNPDYYPPTLNLIWLLKQKHKICIFSRNMADVDDSFYDGIEHYRFGKNLSATDCIKASPLLKLLEYLLFVFKTTVHAIKCECKVVVVYDPYALLPAILLKMINQKINIFYHEHELTILNKDKVNSLAYWVKKIVYRNLNRCSWISQADVRRAEVFQKKLNLQKVESVRNFSLKTFDYEKKKNNLCSEYKEKGYMVFGFIGLVSIDSYIDDLIRFVENTKLKIFIALAGYRWGDDIFERMSKFEDKFNDSKIAYLNSLNVQAKYNFINSIDVGLILYKFKKGNIEMGAGASNKVGEYMAFGKPIIYPEWWDYEPFYKEIGLSYKDENEIVHNIERLSTDSALREKLSSNAIGIFNEKNNYESETKEMIKLIDKFMWKNEKQ